MTDMPDLQIARLSATLAEGEAYTFTLTLPEGGLDDDTQIRWEIIPKGALPTTDSDFDLPRLVLDDVDFMAFAGTRVIPADATGPQTVTITPEDDGLEELPSNFELRVYQVVQGGDDLLIKKQSVTLTDEDDPSSDDSLPVPTVSGNGDENIITIASDSETKYDGGAGDDAYVVTRFQTCDATIANSGTGDRDVIHFDIGVGITAIDNTASDATLPAGAVKLTLASGGALTIEDAANFEYRMGSGIKTDFDDFAEEVRNTLELSLKVQTLAEPEAAGSDTLPLQNVVGDIAENVLAADGDADAKLLGGRGDDVYVIGRHQKGDVRILDVTDDNLIKFDFGVKITGFTETTMRAGAILSELTLTLEDTDAAADAQPQVVIRYPAKFFRYQLGDAVVRDYEGFKAFLGVTGLSGTLAYTVREAAVPAQAANAADIVAATYAATEGEAVSISLVGLFEDANGDPITYRVRLLQDHDNNPATPDQETGLPTWLTFDGDTLTAASATEGDYKIAVYASSGRDDEDEAFSPYIFTLDVDAADTTAGAPTAVVPTSTESRQDIINLGVNPNGHTFVTADFEPDFLYVLAPYPVLRYSDVEDANTDLIITMQYTDVNGNAQTIRLPNDVIIRLHPHALNNPDIDPTRPGVQIADNDPDVEAVPPDPNVPGDKGTEAKEGRPGVQLRSGETLVAHDFFPHLKFGTSLRLTRKDAEGIVEVDDILAYVSTLPVLQPFSKGQVVTDVLTFTVTDTDGKSDTSTFEISYTGVNDRITGFNVKQGTLNDVDLTDGEDNEAGGILAISDFDTDDEYVLTVKILDEGNTIVEQDLAYNFGDPITIDHGVFSAVFDAATKEVTWQFVGNEDAIAVLDTGQDVEYDIVLTATEFAPQFDHPDGGAATLAERQGDTSQELQFTLNIQGRPSAPVFKDFRDGDGEVISDPARIEIDFTAAAGVALLTFTVSDPENTLVTLGELGGASATYFQLSDLGSGRYEISFVGAEGTRILPADTSSGGGRLDHYLLRITASDGLRNTAHELQLHRDAPAPEPAPSFDPADLDFGYDPFGDDPFGDGGTGSAPVDIA